MTAPGVYEDMPEDEYHGHRWVLSSSGAKALMPPSCPALFRYLVDHPKSSKEFDYGSAAHKFVLGTGPEIHIVQEDSWRKNVAQDAAKEARARGEIPLLWKDYQQVKAMGDALQRNPLAARILQVGRAELSMFWEDDTLMRRARLDFLPRDKFGGRDVIADYKTTDSCDPDAIERSIWNFRYHQQAAWYLDGSINRELVAPDAVFVFIFQMKTAPYLANVVQLDAELLDDGRTRNRQALDIFGECLAADTWPSHSEGIPVMSMPRWAQKREVAW